MTKEGANKQFKSFDLKVEKTVANNDHSVMNEDLTNKDMEDMVIFYNSPKDKMKDYLEVFLHSKIEVLEVIDDDEVKFEVKECVKELQVDFIGTKSITLNMDFSLAYTHHKLYFEVHMSKTYYFMNMLATMLYSNYLFMWKGRIQFLKVNLKASLSKVKGLWGLSSIILAK